MATKYKPKDNDIYVKKKPEYGTRDNDIFHITSGTTDGVQIYPKNQATDKITFDDMNITSIKAAHIEKTKDIKLTYVVDSTEKTLIIKDYFSSTKATAPKSSLKNILFTKSATEYNLSVATDLLFTNMTKLDSKTNKITGSNFADYVDLSSSSYVDYTVNAGNGNDYIISGHGNDSLTGGKGTNTYVYKDSFFYYGNDTINLTKGETAKINYEKNSSQTEYKLDGQGNAIIHLNKYNTGDNVILKDFAKKDIVEKIEFVAANETKNLKEILWYYAPSGDYSGSYLNEHIDAKWISTAKKDRKGNTVAYTFKTGSGNDIIESSKFADKITAGTGTNEIRYATQVVSNKIFDGLNQLAGDIIYLTKDENLTIDLTGISYSAVATYALSGKDLIVTVNVGTSSKSFTIANYGTKDVVGANGKVILVDQNDVQSDLKNDAIVVVNGTKGTFHNDIIDQSDYKIYKTVKVGKTTTKEIETNTAKKGLTITGAAGNDDITGSNYSDTIKGGDGDDTIYGGTGNDTIYGGAGKDIIDGGAGNDKIYGEAGANKIKFKAGDGIDTVYSGTGEDTLEFSGISFSDLQFSRGKNQKDKNDLIIKYSENDSVTVKNYFAIDKKTKLPTTSVKYITTNEGTFVAGPLLIVTGEGELNGDDYINFIYGSNVSDTINAYGENDIINGGDGDDTINGGDGNDTINGEGGSDTIYCGDGADTVYGGDGDDTIYGNTGSNTIYGDNGNDTIYGGDYSENIYGGAGDDTIHGGSGADNIYGGSGDDTIYGEGSNDDIYTGTGDDTINAGGGWNTILLDTGNKTIENGHGNEDVLVFINETDLNNLSGYVSGDDLVITDTKGTSATLKNYFTEDHSTKGLKIREKSSTQRLVVSGNLPVITTSDETEINGTKCMDIITSTNNDGVVINSYAGDDTIYTGDGNDTINAGTGTNTIVIGAGNKTIINGGGVDTIVLSKETSLDNITRHISGNNLVITDSDGNSTTLLNYFSEGHSVTTVKVGDKSKDIDKIPVQAPDNYIVGTKGNDKLNGSEKNNVIYGCAGNDTINGNAGNDRIIGGMGNDIINGGDGNDVIDSGTGEDTIYGGAGNNIIYLGEGNKTIEKGTGEDTLVFSNETNIDNLRGQVSGNDLVITDSKGTSATLKNYLTDGHSVSTLQVGYMTMNIADLSNIITSGKNEIDGTKIKDAITATNPNGTTINGYEGNDTINGGNGADTIYGGDDADIIYGNAGDDTIYGDDDADIIYGNAGDDTIYGDDDADIIYGNAGADTIYGGNGDDNMYGGDGDDTIYSGTGDDFISGGDGKNTIYLDADNKTITNGGGNDTLVFSNETDIKNLEVSVSDSNVIISDSKGTSVTLSNYTDGCSVSTVQVGDKTKDINDLRNSIESGEMYVYGTFFHDVITATENTYQEIYGYAGNDTIYGGDGSNYIFGDENAVYPTYAGDDIIYGRGGIDHLFGGLGNDTIYGGADNDFINGEWGEDTLYGDEGNDEIDGGGLKDTIYGGVGNDILHGGDGNDTLYGESGNDTIYGDAGIDTIYGGLGNDILRGGADSDKYIQEDLSSYHDEIYDDSGDNDSIEIGVNKANIIIRYDVKIDAEGHIIEDESKNMYITNTADFGDTAKGLKVTDQFVSGHSIESIKTADNYTLTTTQISALRSDIATWLSGSGYDSVQAVLNSGDTDVIGDLIAEFQKAEWQQPNV